MKSSEIRRAFIEFFAERGHVQVPSSSLIPTDPTVLLTTAGMQQMVPYFLGLERPPHTRLTSIQKCFRTVDIDEVGDESHLTFFEMLGNFSIGDYFKAEAISWAWEFLTKWLGVPAERWYPTVHPEDDFSYRYWRDEIGVPEERIFKLEDNWWGPVGATGPNGPDSEIHYDRGPEHGCGKPTCGPGCDCGRFLETWNLVFMEFYKELDETQRPLPRKNIDTGMGLERISLILQGVGSVFETDLFYPILTQAATIAGVRYKEDARIDRSLRVIADHARGVTFLVGDGVFPSNEGRGYVLRRVLRRAVRHGRLLGIERPFLGQLADVVIELFSPYYPNLVEQRERIHRVIDHEEEHFQRTLATGLARFEALVDQLQRSGERIIPGDEAFRLYDTYGFPLELTEELAREAGLAVDRVGFERALERQRELSRASVGRFADTQRQRADLYARFSERPTEFLGYEQLQAEATVVGILGIDQTREEAEAGDQVEIVLDRTPFYGEAGGQVGDTGELRTDTGVFVVEDTQRPTPELIVHRGQVREGYLRVGQRVVALVDAERRAAIRRNHTATHLLHAALRRVLGEHALQAGSLVAPDRLRFDFAHHEAVQPVQLRTIEELVNEQIVRNLPVEVRYQPLREALSEGAIALFGEKYGEIVRVVSIDAFSKELCGGTHVSRTGEIGYFLISDETSVASGIRRIEALTGPAAVRAARQIVNVASQTAQLLHVPVERLPEQVERLQQQLRDQEREIARLSADLALERAAPLVEHAHRVDGFRVVSARIEVPSLDVLRRLGDRLRERIGSGVIILGTAIENRPTILAMATRDAVQRGVHAGRVVQVVAPLLGGRGGGRADMAQGGGADASRLDEALAAARAEVERQLRGEAAS
ncbi:alanine--tRNA ligase [Thermomicrobium sp. CFH 73360]|uniref:alanine--tRNA ligase n=1 Tax=Thermomicrobium sp. CFH 73360 TaxID=2951987 RepID=UPI0020775D03|nr:alanine--tRNA ligase [Thermomicrobium sp. CFH 73360]MCM8746633.1 alanine--tRNA ligase [Thermomicrobium sp. CFH 73360]